MKKQISVSQHSSISQADDCSSPYARVRSQTHAYDKVRPAEHPYAQVKSINDNGNRPSTSAAATANSNQNAENNNPNDNDPISRRSSRESLLDSVDGRQHQVSIPRNENLLKFVDRFKLQFHFINSRWFRLHQQSQAECKLVKNCRIWRHRSSNSRSSTSAVIHKIRRVSLLISFGRKQIS